MTWGGVVYVCVCVCVCGRGGRGLQCAKYSSNQRWMNSVIRLGSNKAVWRTAISPIAELWVLYIISLRQTFDPKLINIFQRVQEIWSEHEILGSNSWPLTVTLTLSQHAWVMGSAHCLTKANIWPKFHENLSKGSGDMERTRRCYGRTDGRTKAISIIPICFMVGN